MYALIWLALYAAMIYGWVMNIVKLATATGPVATWAAMEIIRVIGIFVPPVGVIMGYV